jgi:hypothetical protein
LRKKNILTVFRTKRAFYGLRWSSRLTKSFREMGFKVTGHLSLHASGATNNVQTTLEAFGTAYPMTETEFLPSHHIVSKASIRLYNRSKGLGHFSFQPSLFDQLSRVPRPRSTRLFDIYCCFKTGSKFNQTLEDYVAP